MSKIKLPIVFTDPRLKVSSDLKTQLLDALPEGSQWLQADAKYGTTLSGRVVTLTDLRSGVVWQASGSGPLLAAEESYAGYTVAQLESGVDRSIRAPAALDLDGSWSVVMFVRRGATPAGTQVFWGQNGDVGPGAFLAQSALPSAFQAFFRGAGININAVSAGPDETPRLVVVDYNGIRLRGQADTGPTASVVASGALPSVNVVSRIGRHYNTDFGRGDWSDFIFIPGLALHDPENTDLIALVRAYFSGVYQS